MPPASGGFFFWSNGMKDVLAYEATVNDSAWTLVAAFTKLRIRYFHLQLLTPIGTKVIFSWDQENTHIISGIYDQSLTFDDRPVTGKLYAKITEGESSETVIAHIW